MSLVGYKSSKPTTFVCDQYEFAGKYVAGDYITKDFTKIPKNHYEIIVRFGIGFMGNWNAQEEIIVNVDGKNFSKAYTTCYMPQGLCHTAGQDCIKIISHAVPHSSENVSVTISSSITETDDNLQFWGVKDLLIVAKLCNSKCETCFGPNAGDCITCAPGFFLWGNLCVEECEELYYPS